MPRRRLHNIFRRDANHFHGWIVELKRQGSRHRRYFKDGDDREAALRRAVRWRDKMIDALAPPRKFKRRYVLSRTGIVGVARVLDRTRSGRIVPRYTAGWFDEHGRRHKRSFSVLEYGAATARALAIDTRKCVLAEMLQPRKGGGGAAGAFASKRRSTRRRPRE